MLKSILGKSNFMMINDFDVMVFINCYISGVGGNLVAVQASRITTLLHLQKRKGIVEDVKGCPNVFGTFCKSSKF